jgi:hypothetical protein
MNELTLTLGRWSSLIALLSVVACSNAADGKSSANGGSDAGSPAGGSGVAGGGKGGGGATAGTGGTGGGAGSAGTSAGGSSGGLGGTLGSGGTTSGGTAGSGGEGGGTIWYDGEPDGASFSTGLASVPAGSTVSETTDDPHAGTTCMNANLDATGGWASLDWNFSKDYAPRDLSSYTTMEFWIRTGSGTLTDLSFEMHTAAGGGCAWLHLQDYLPGGATTTWQQVSIPMSDFQIDRTQIKVVNFWLVSGTTSIFIDDGRWL